MKVARTGRMRATAVSLLVGLATPVASPLMVRAAEPAPVDPVVRFKELSAKGEAAYQARQYQAAIDAYLEAYGVLGSADVLYNIAYIYDHHLQRRDMAQDFYRRVIRTPDSSKEIVELSVKRVAELEAQDKVAANVLKPEDPATKPVDKPVGPTGPVREGPGLDDRLVRDNGPGPAPWVLVGLGGAALIGGVVFGVIAQGTNDDFKAEDDLTKKRALESDGKSQALTSDILGITGGVIVATGLIWYFAASGGEPAPTRTTFELPAVRPMLLKDGIGLALGGTL